MYVQRTILASAVLTALAPCAFAQTTSGQPVATVVVTATPFNAAEGDQILTPAKVLAGDELRNKLGGSLGETLSSELGVSASAFGAGASRPIIRGLEGNRVKVLENGMSVSDLSGLSNDHAVTGEAATARQIEILRGPAALLYGSGAIGGLVNVVNERIPTELHEKPSGVVETRYSSVDHGRAVSYSADATSGKVALHVDGSGRDAGDYRVPGLPDGDTLQNSALRQHTLGAGASYVGKRGYLGASVSTLKKKYGIPGGEGSRIDLDQTRYDIDGQLDAPMAGFEKLRFRAGYSDYGHVELNAEGGPETVFSNRSLESRLELAHKPLSGWLKGWEGSFGIQTEHTRFSGLSADSGESATVPVTVSDTHAAFLVEQRQFGKTRVNAGVRVESVKREPEGAAPRRSFDLLSWSAGAIWPLAKDYTVGVTASVAQRAPGTDELYSGGPHESTLTYDIGNPNFNKETSRNLELSFRKVTGLVRWQANLFENRVRDFIYGEVGDTLLDDEGKPGDELRERIFRQADATIRGMEAEISYNRHPHADGLSLRAFGDLSRGSLDDAGSLPLQPAKRVGFEAGYREGALRGGVSVLRALKQERLASFESTPTPAYTQLDANLSYTQRFRNADLTWFIIGKNLLDEDIRISTSVLKDVAPLPGRNITVGVRAAF
ncbi:TonB-dependent receptor [Massilia sp. BSC265]|uniref:TonB-dependent receptor n=1 Tax=Massilia sp. BSC265 TaxID=1549812 RepID=UPI0004E94477|nr:TonB-dependent receptor [Massilia sp. BSC265]KFI06789.1 TonB-dependent receptor [Massilia sp. BSC265]